MPPPPSHINLDEVDFGKTLRGLQKSDCVFERFILKRMLGRGGMGVVWLALDQRLGRDVALKFAPEVVRWDEVAVEELKEETRKGLQLAHPNIVRISDFLLDEAHAAISMEFIDGENLSAMRLRMPNKVFEAQQMAAWLPQLLDALEYAHVSAKVIHRDLKPANVMMDRAGVLRVTDFGIARSISDALDRATHTVASRGTLAYMSPQQAAGETPQISDDLYALGSTLYELLTGKPPFYAGNIARQLATEPVLPLAERRAEFGVDAEAIPPAWESTILACLAKLPGERPDSIAEVRRRLGLSSRLVVGVGGIYGAATSTQPQGTPTYQSSAAHGATVSAPTPELAHILFADVVGYSQLPSEEQARLVQQLRTAVRQAPEFVRARQAGELISVPAGDGMALVFFGKDAAAPLRAAREIFEAIRQEPTFCLRIGLHSGQVYRVPDINGNETVAGAGINLAQRVMDCGDAGHILMSQVHASHLRQNAQWASHVHDLGEAEVKHGVRLHLCHFWDGECGNPLPPKRLLPSRTTEAPAVTGARVALIYKRHAEADESLLQSLEDGLRDRGCEVFVDRHLRIGLDWAREVERALRNADAVVPIISQEAMTSDMLAYELEIADDAAQRQGGRPRLLPIRVKWEGPLSPNLGTILDPIQYALWRGPEDTAGVVQEITAALAEPQGPAIRNPRAVEPPGGAMPLDSRYYIERPTDEQFHAAVARRDSLILVEGARQMGKTSLLSRGLQQARAHGAKVTCTDFQKLNSGDLASLETFYLTLGTALANQLDLDKYPEDTWRPKAGPNQNFESYIKRQVLGSQKAPFVWALDEVDRLFSCPFGSEVFGLFRSWHNARALDPESPWHRFTMIICYATEAHLFITDINQSPFNVGTRVRLRDFGPSEMQQINARYGQPLTTPEQFDRFYKLLGGQPYLVRRGLHEMVTHQTSLEELQRTAPLEQGPFGDHLKRFLVLLSGNADALAYLSSLLAGKRGNDPKLFYRLRAAGLLRGETLADADFRCDLYAQYLKRHLP